MNKYRGIRVIERQDLPALLSMQQCIDVIDDCMRQVSSGEVELPPRWGLPVPGRGAMGMMPGYLGDPACFGIKLVSLFPQNTAHGLSSHSGLMLLFETEFGQPIAMMDAGYLTALRTAAASAVATRALARTSATRLAILGCGEQARFHAAAIQCVRNIEEIIVWGRDPAKAAAFADELGASSNITVRTATSTAAAVASADIVCTVTASDDPILMGADLPAGCHVNAVGSSVASKREIDSDAVLLSRYFVDYRPSALAQAGELRDALDAGLISEDHIRGEIGEVLADRCDGRVQDTDITLYRSLGVAAQDLASAHLIFERAAEHDVGVLVCV